VLRDEGHPSGIAAITVAEGGENTIVVAPGANGALRPEEVRRGLGEAAFEVLLAQLEVPIGCLIAAAEAAEGRVFVLNPAPAQALPDELLCRVDYLTPNEREAAMLSGVAPTDDESCLEAARPLLARGVGNVLITLGERGSFLATPQGGQHFPTIAVRPVDTTAAGDAFNGALAYFLAQGHEPKNAILLANRVGALSTTKRGAQDSMPSLDELREVAADLL
jgi:ribokinase